MATKDAYAPRLTPGEWLLPRLRDDNGTFEFPAVSLAATSAPHGVFPRGLPCLAAARDLSPGAALPLFGRRVPAFPPEFYPTLSRTHPGVVVSTTHTEFDLDTSATPADFVSVAVPSVAGVPSAPAVVGVRGLGLLPFLREVTPASTLLLNVVLQEAPRDWHARPEFAPLVSWMRSSDADGALSAALGLGRGVGRGLGDDGGGGGATLAGLPLWYAVVVAAVSEHGHLYTLVNNVTTTGRMMTHGSPSCFVTCPAAKSLLTCVPQGSMALLHRVLDGQVHATREQYRAQLSKPTARGSDSETMERVLMDLKRVMVDVHNADAASPVPTLPPLLALFAEVCTDGGGGGVGGGTEGGGAGGSASRKRRHHYLVPRPAHELHGTTPAAQVPGMSVAFFPSSAMPGTTPTM